MTQLLDDLIQLVALKSVEQYGRWQCSTHVFIIYLVFVVNVETVETFENQLKKF